ncbi:glycosyltransferase family 2 protein [uncultured Bacteroides sp.]|uniref:glycosyltransferase family 2 protein n=1 Tax=uncultured Bacteroides sp. TaxID=162156 RepID=UPI0025914260|nr:glycosyltransferase family 2 protein [uncultured Bacteroides sp.]
MISVVIPLFNKEQSIDSTLQTVLKQTFQDFEIVIVDDGSTDHSVEKVKKVIDPRIRLIHQTNAGVSAARNRGIEEAKGEYIAFLDADDEWKPDYLKTQYELTQKYPECNVFACNYEFKDAQGKVTPTIIRKLPFESEKGILSNYFEVASCSHQPLWTSAVMVKKNAIQSIGGFPIGIKSGEDLLTWARLAVNGKIAYAKQAYAVFNVEGYSISEKPKRIPAEQDIVGQELKALLKAHPSKGLRLYNALWHKMRSSIYLRLKMRKKSIREAFISIKYNPLNYKLYIYIVLNLLPVKI